MLGLLIRQILDEAIGAEDLNKVHLMEAAIASNATLQGSFTQIERLAYRLLDWGDFRVYRVVRRRTRPWPIAARSAGRNRGEPAPSIWLRCGDEASSRREPVIVRDVRTDDRLTRPRRMMSGCW